MKINFGKTALLVIDMQADFYADGGNTARRTKNVYQMQALPPKIDSFATQLRQRGGKIIFTKFIYNPEFSPTNFTEIIGETKKSNWLCVQDTPGAELSGVTPLPEDTVITKYSYDCFAGTDLLDRLNAQDIETVVLTGVRTEVCILATASRSFAEGFRTVIISDLVGTYDDLKTTTLKDLEYACYVTTSEKFLTLAAT